jgi:ABC transport system ATP-binding/permease protein
VAAQGIKARRTRDEGRVRALMAMREPSGRRGARRPGTVRLQVTEAGESVGKVVFEAEGVTQGRSATAGRARLLDAHDARRPHRPDRPERRRQDHAAAMLLGELAPDAGEVRRGANVQVAYYDQQREQLDPERTVFDTVGEGNDTVEVNGSRARARLPAATSCSRPSARGRR